MATEPVTTGAPTCASSIQRRNLIAAMIAAPAIATAGAFAASGADAAVLNAWERRQRALAVIETRGLFYYAETHSPADAEVYDQAEDELSRLSAITPRGALVQLWVAFAHVGTCFNDEDRALHDMIRRADLARLRPLKRDLDFDQHMILSAIEALTSIAGRA